MNNCCRNKTRCGCEDPCGCPLRVLSIEQIDTSRPGLLRFNLDGGSVEYDFADLIASTETDTFLRIDQTARTLKYLAEGHTNNIPASQLGSILHLADIGDINVKDVTQNSLLVYQKNSECATSCGSVQNQWIAWNSDEQLVEKVNTIMGFDDDEFPRAIEPPEAANQYSLFMWRGANKAGYTHPAELSGAPSTDDSGKSHLLFENPRTHEIEALPVYVSIVDGLVTIRTTEA